MAEILPVEPSDQFDADAREFVALSLMIDDLTKKRDLIKARLSDVVDSTGDEDESGHRTLPLDSPLGNVTGFKRERRVSYTTDEYMADAILTGKGLHKRCIKTVEKVDQDEVFACLQEGLLTAEEVEAMFPPRIQWAFKQVKSK